MSSVFMSHNVIAFIQQLLLVFSALLSCNSVFPLSVYSAVMLCSQDFFPVVFVSSFRSIDLSKLFIV